MPNAIRTFLNSLSPSQRKLAKAAKIQAKKKPAAEEPVAVDEDGDGIEDEEEEETDEEAAPAEPTAVDEDGDGVEDEEEEEEPAPAPPPASGKRQKGSARAPSNRIAAAEARALAAEKRARSAEAAVGRIEADMRREKYRSEANGLFLAGASTDQIADVLADADERLGKANAAALRGLLKSSSEALKRSSVFRELGGATGANASSAIAKINAAAKKIQAADPKLSEAEATDKALEQNPALYDAYNAEMSRN